ncbi:hypothetical protein JY97_09720 [Alkalispirochaeta odontotermitis]|nr:hypothetical protein JY97_09720 [Alkalispirochaeta odontotermitis]
MVELSAVLKGANFTWKSSGIEVARNLWLNLDGGQIHALMGENGVGKTTLGHIITGVLQPDSGILQIGKRHYNLNKHRDGLFREFGLVRQHCIWPPNFRIREAAFLGSKPHGLRAQNKKFSQTAERWGFGDINPEERVGRMDAASLQRAQMVVALMMEAKFIVLDEPSSAWEEGHEAEFFGLLELLRAEGRAILLITHRIDDVFRIADVITVLREGRIVGTWNIEEISKKGLISAMFEGDKFTGPGLSIDTKRVIGGKTQPGNNQTRISRESIKPVLEARNLGHSRQLKAISFKVFPGEILAITGLRREGLSCLEDVLTGNIESASGELLIDSEPCRGSLELRRRGLRYVPSDKLERGSSLDSTLAENIMALESAKLSKCGWLNPALLNKHAETRKPGWGALGKVNRKLGEFSGGNIQRAILAREIGTGAKVYVLVDPVWGLDDLSRKKVYTQIKKIRDRGAAILLLATNLDEALEIANRIGVIHDGQLLEIRDAVDWNKNELQRTIAGLGV